MPKIIACTVSPDDWWGSFTWAHFLFKEIVERGSDENSIQCPRCIVCNPGQQTNLFQIKPLPVSISTILTGRTNYPISHYLGFAYGLSSKLSNSPISQYGSSLDSFPFYSQPPFMGWIHLHIFLITLTWYPLYLVPILDSASFPLFFKIINYPTRGFQFPVNLQPLSFNFRYNSIQEKTINTKYRKDNTSSTRYFPVRCLFTCYPLSCLLVILHHTFFE